MQKIFFEFKRKFNTKEIDFSELDRTLEETKAKKLSLAGTIQYLDIISLVKKHIEEKGVKVILKKGPTYSGHVLGCNSQAFDSKADILLLLADGKFHALNNSLQLQKEIYVFNTKSIEKITQEEINKEIQRRTAKIKKFLSEDKIGVIVSTKTGQNFKNITDLAKKIKSKGKNVYLFEADNINLGELDNFQIPIYINTACSGLELDNPRILNASHILSYI